jgi:small subunit ribosomal protein S1
MSDNQQDHVPDGTIDSTPDSTASSAPDNVPNHAPTSPATTTPDNVPEAAPTQLDAELEKELAQALDDQSIEQLMAESEPPVAPRPEPDADASGRGEGHGEIHLQMKRGRIAAIRGEDVFIELAGEAGKLQGIVPLVQFDRPPRMGSVMDFVLDHVDEQQGLVLLSREGAVSRSNWEQLKRGTIVEARVISSNKGGLQLEMVGGIRAFMPASQVDLRHIADLETLVGQKLEGMIIEIDRRSKNVVLNRRQLLEQQRAAARSKLMAELEVGQVRDGRVSSVVDFGAFVDLGGVDGMVHVSDMSYSRVDKPSDILKVGQDIKVKVLKIDLQKDRIGLGLKQIEPDPWDGVENKYKAGDQVSIRVVRTANFGAFVELEAGIDALLPISEMSWKRVGNAEQVVHVGDVLRAAVLNVDVKQHRISVSLKQDQGDPWIGAEHKYAKNSLVTGKVISVAEFGAFVELETGVEGLVHISELSDQHVDRVDNVLQIGQDKEFRVLDISEDDRKIKLSLKAVNAPPPQEAEPETSAAAQQAKARKAPENLKGGMDARGIGLGGLSLDDLK